MSSGVESSRSIGNIPRGVNNENGDKAPVKTLREKLHETSIHTFAAQNPNVNIQTSGASIW